MRAAPAALHNASHMSDNHLCFQSALNMKRLVKSVPGTAPNANELTHPKPGPPGTHQISVIHGFGDMASRMTYAEFRISTHFEKQRQLTSRQDICLDEQLKTALQRSDIERVRRVLQLHALGGGFKNEPPLHTAARCGYENVVSALISSGDDIETMHGAGAVLRTAAMYGSADVVRFLVDCRADIYATDKINGMIPLHEAAYSGHVESTKILIAAGTHVDARSLSECTPLILAAKAGARAGDTLAAVQTLLAARADINARDHNGGSSLHWTACKGYFEKTRALVEAGVDLNAQDFKGETALDWIKGRYPKISKFLIAAAAFKAKARHAKPPFPVLISQHQGQCSSGVNNPPLSRPKTFWKITDAARITPSFMFEDFKVRLYY